MSDELETCSCSSLVACHELNKLSMSSSVMPASSGLSCAVCSDSRVISSKMVANSRDACLTRNLTSPKLERSSKTTTSNVRPMMQMCMDSRSPSCESVG